MAASGGPRCGGGSLGLLVWLLVFRPLLGEGDGPKEASTMSPTLQGAPSTSGCPTTETGSPVPSPTAVGETLKPAQTPAFEPLPPQGTASVQDGIGLPGIPRGILPGWRGAEGSGCPGGIESKPGSAPSAGGVVSLMLEEALVVVGTGEAGAAGGVGALGGRQWRHLQPFVPSPGTCGHRVTRIGGRVPSPERKWPWQVSVQINNVHKCGGSLIAPRWVLTAAHCVRGYSEYTVRLGDTLLQSNSQNAVVIPVQDIICYKYYSYHTMRHDIALALLAFSVNYSAYIQPVCLPGKDFEVKAGTMCWATGWGRTLQFEPSSVPTLQETEQVILHYPKCNRMIKQQENPFPKVVRKGMICGYHENSGGPCKGDSGGPLVCQFNDIWIQMGIVSWGVHCGFREVPVVYTDVRFYKDWVYGMMSQASILDSGGFFIPWVCLVLALSILVAL